MSPAIKQKGITRSELIAQVRAAKPKTKEQRNAITCALIGHSLIQTLFWGYWSCGRCEAQLGDSLGGAYSGDNVVIVGHDCDTCQKNYKKLDWRHKLYALNPFKDA